MLDENGKVLYAVTIDFASKALRSKWSDAAVAVIEAFQKSDADIAFIAPPAVRELLEARPRTATYGSSYIWEANQVASCPAYSCSLMPTATMISGPVVAGGLRDLGAGDRDRDRSVYLVQVGRRASPRRADLRRGDRRRPDRVLQIDERELMIMGIRIRIAHECFVGREVAAVGQIVDVDPIDAAGLLAGGHEALDPVAAKTAIDAWNLRVHRAAEASQPRGSVLPFALGGGRWH